MCGTPPYSRAHTRERLTTDLRGLQVPRLDTEPALASKRPGIPLDELTRGRIEHLLPLIDRWIDDVRAHSAEGKQTTKPVTRPRHRTGDPNRRDHMPRTQLHAPGPIAARNQDELRM